MKFWTKYKIENSQREAFQEILNKKVAKRLLGKNLCLVQRVQLAATAKQAGRVNGRRRDEAAAKNEDYEGFDEEDQIKRKNGRGKPMVGY